MQMVFTGGEVVLEEKKNLTPTPRGVLEGPEGPLVGQKTTKIDLIRERLLIFMYFLLQKRRKK